MTCTSRLRLVVYSGHGWKSGSLHPMQAAAEQTLCSLNVFNPFCWRGGCRAGCIDSMASVHRWNIPQSSSPRVTSGSLIMEPDGGFLLSVKRHRVFTLFLICKWRFCTVVLLLCLYFILLVCDPFNLCQVLFS